MTLVQQVLNRFDKIRHGLPARVLKPRMSALECWKSRYSQTWDLKMSRALVEREGDMVGPNALYLRQPFRIEEYTILDALLRHLIERKGEVKVLDVACGSGLACFFIAVNRKRYANKVKYLGVDSSESQLFCAKLRNPWSFATFQVGNLFDTGLPSDEFDLVLNWQTINHVGRIKDALQELNRVSRGLAYVINYVYFDDKRFTESYGEDTDEAEWGGLAWAFNRDKIVAFIQDLGVDQCWRTIAAPSFNRTFPSGSTSEHTLLVKERGLIADWDDLHFDETWRENIVVL